MIKIIVESRAGEGKTTIAELIDLALNDAGIPFEIIDTDVRPFDHKTHQQRLLAIANRLKKSNQKVHIVTRAINREPIENP